MSITVESTTDNEELVEKAQASEPAVEKESVSSEKESQDEKSEESETSTESDDSNSDDQSENDDQSESEEKEVKEDNDADDESESEGKHAKGARKRIKKLAAKLTVKDQEIDYWKKMAFERENASKRSADPQKEEAISKDANERPNADDFESHDEWEDAVIDWKLEKREAQRNAVNKESEIKSEAQKKIEVHNKRVDEFKETTPDFNVVLDEFVESEGDAKFSLGLQEAIYESEIGAEVLYELLKNPEEFHKINSMYPIKAAKEIGKIEARIQSSQQPSPTKKITTKAPPPPTPVGRGSDKATKRSVYDAENLSQAEFEKLREA